MKKRKSGAKKKFFEVPMPLTASKINLYSYSIEELDNSVVKLDLTKNLRGKNLELRARIKIKDGKPQGELISIQLLPIYIRKVMRRGTDYVEDSFSTQTKDAKIRIKPFLITRNRVSREVKKTIRTAVRKHLESHATIRTSQEIFSEIMSNKLQKELSLKIKKIYPLALCEIRILEIEEKLELKPKEKTSKKKDSKETDSNQ